MPMRLYLSSYRLGARAGVLRWGGPSRGRALVVMNACDVYGADRLRSWDRESADLDALGYAATELDLREHVADPGALLGRLVAADLVWVVGGGAYALATVMTAAGFGAAIREVWRTGGPIYAGYSAGSCVAGPDLQGIELIDDPDDIPPDYPDVPARTLGLIPERIIPHWRSDHRGAPGADLAVGSLSARGLPFLALRDGQEHLVGFSEAEGARRRRAGGRPDPGG